MENVLDFEAVAFSENGLCYAADFENNGLYEVNLDEQKCKYITIFPNEDIAGKRIYCSAVYHDSKVYFTPMSGKYISIFDVLKNEIEQVRIPDPSTEYSFYKESQKFSQAVYHKGYIYLFPFTYPGILKFNIETNKIKIINNWIPDEGYFFRGGMSVDGLHVYAPSGINNVILDFNLEDDRAVIYRIGKYNNGAMCIYKHNDFFWIAPRLQGSIVVWNPDHGKINEIIDYPDDFKAEKIVFSKIICLENKLLFIPASANKVLTVDVNTKKLLVDDRWKLYDHTMIACMFETDSYYYFRKSSHVVGIYKRYKIRKSDGKIDAYVFTVENHNDFKKDYFNACIEQGRVMKESQNFKFGDFLNLL